MSLITKLFQFVLLTSKKYNIDESHGLSHSMNVLHFAHNIYEAEKINYPILESQSKIIYVSSIIHDMCDKKYLDENIGLKEINHFLEEKLTPAEIDITKRIINTMSYSKVKKQGFPELHEYQMAYHVVREADLLAAYDFDRCMLYNIHMQTKPTINNPTPINNDIKILDAFNNASELFQNRVLKHNHDNLFVTNYSKHNYLPLHIDAIKRINTWKNILKTPIK
jgi:HD superfamily phosphodiesterase